MLAISRTPPLRRLGAAPAIAATAWHNTMGQPRPASPSEDHHEDERKLHLAENLWKAIVFVFAEVTAVLRFIGRSPHHFDSFIHWLDQLDPSRALASWASRPPT